MRFLFYLPAVTDRYFDFALLALFNLLHDRHEVHVAIPKRWYSSGVSDHQIRACSGLSRIFWHVLDFDGHESLRTTPSNYKFLFDKINSIQPDYTLCRSADSTTPRLFPGKTRFLMEAILPPFIPVSGSTGHIILDGPRFFDYGFFPALSEDKKEALGRLMGPAWDSANARLETSPEAREMFFRDAGLPSDRKVLALPLNAEAPTNFFIKVHSRTPSNVRLVDEIASQLGDEWVLALTKHPLNVNGNPAIDISGEPIEPMVEKWREKVFIVSAPGPLHNSTASLLKLCDGAIVCDSKSIGYVAFFGKPFLRISRYDSAPWMKAYSNLKHFLDDLRAGVASSPSQAVAKIWFAYHYANRVFESGDAALTPDELIDRIEVEVNPDRWGRGLSRIC